MKIKAKYLMIVGTVLAFSGIGFLLILPNDPMFKIVSVATIVLGLTIQTMGNLMRIPIHLFKSEGDKQ